MTAMPAMLVSEQILFERSVLNIPTDPMQVLKLVYLSHGWVLGIHNEPLIGEPVEAWTYGPVVPSVYFTYKRFGRNPITDDTQDVSFGFSDEQLDIIRAVLDIYKDTPGATLSAITHKKGSPWDITYHKYGTGSIIPNDLIKNYYRSLIEKANDEH